MKKVKTATITWITYLNFGTFLQAYALQKIINSLGYENVILSDKSIIDSLTNTRKIRLFLSRIKWFVLNLLRKPDCRIRESIESYELFKKQFLKIDETWINTEELNERYDVFVCGSDQIWSPNVPFHSYYYIGFTNKKKIAYAPSLGSFDYPQDKVSIIKPYLKSFSNLSVREIQGERIIKEKFGLDCRTVIDPTLLLDRNDWEKLAKRKEDHEYILCYFLTYNEVYLRFVRDFADRKGLELRLFITDIRYKNYADKPLYVGPQEFLNEIRNSNYFFTDSFHGSIFAIQFEKEFYTFKRFKDDAKNNQNSRIVNLFEMLGLMSRFLSEEETFKVDLLDMIDYHTVKDMLSIERSMSLNYLKEALEVNN